MHRTTLIVGLILVAVVASLLSGSATVEAEELPPAGECKCVCLADGTIKVVCGHFDDSTERNQAILTTRFGCIMTRYCDSPAPEESDQETEVSLAFGYALAYNPPSYLLYTELPILEEHDGIARHLNHFGPAVDEPLKLSFWVDDGPPGAYVRAVESMALGWDVFTSGEDVTDPHPTPTNRPAEYVFSGVDWVEALSAARTRAPIAFEAQLSVFTGYDGPEEIFEVFSLRGDVHFAGIEGLPPQLFMLERFFGLSPGPMATTQPEEGGSLGSAGGRNNALAWTAPLTRLDLSRPSMEATLEAQGLRPIDFNDYVCGGWQGKVLDTLSAFHAGGNPEESAAFAAFDYGPIQSRWGGHQAVVVYPKGATWRDGIVLDPWPNQVPEVWSMDRWRWRFGVPPGTWGGMGPSRVYQDQYPLTGGTGYPPPPGETARVPNAHREVLRRLPDEVSIDIRRDYFSRASQAERQALIDTLLEDYPDIESTISVAVQCPVRVLIADADGRRLGWQDSETFVNEIPGAYFDEFPEPDGTRGTIALLPMREYRIRLTAVDSGSFEYFYGIPEAGFFTSQSVSVVAGQVFVHDLDAAEPGAALVGSGGLEIPVSATGLEEMGVVPPGQDHIVERTARSRGDSALGSVLLAGAGIAVLVIFAAVGGAAVLWLTGQRSPASTQGIAGKSSAQAAPASVCQVCNASSSPTAPFCHSCGAGLSHAAAESAQRPCRHCGQPARPGAPFCRHCGRSLG